MCVCKNKHKYSFRSATDNVMCDFLINYDS